MNRVVRQATIFLSLLLVVTLVRLPYGSYRERILPLLKQAKIGQVDAQEMNLSFPSTFTVSGLSLLLPAGRIPVPFFVDTIETNFRLLPLLRLAYAMNGRISLYSGHADFQGERGIFSNGGTVSIDAHDININAHPAAKLVGAQGLLSFTLNAEAEKNPVTIADVKSGALRFALTSGEISNAGMFVPLVKLPPVTGLHASGRAELKQGRLWLQESKLDSSLGSAQGSGSVALMPDGRPGAGSLNFRIELSPEGTTTIAPYLALAAQLPVEKPPSNWQVDVTFKQNEKPRAVIRPS